MLNMILLYLNISLTFIVTFLFSLSVLRLFQVKAVCHWNFWILLLQLHINLLTYSLTVSIFTIFRYFNDFYPNSHILTSVIEISAFWSSFNNGISEGTLIFICIERLIATIKNKTYEKVRYSYFIIFGLIATYCFGALNVYIWNISSINKVIASGLSYTVYLFLITFTFLLYQKNKSLKKLSHKADILLTQRYQIHENIRMLRYAMPFLIYPSVGYIIIGTLALYIRYQNSIFAPPETNALYFTGSNLFIFICFYQTNYRILKAKFLSFNRRNRTVLPVNEYVEEKKKTSDIYFVQLKNVW